MAHRIPESSKYDILYLKAAKFNYFEPKIGRYSYEPVLDPQIKEYLQMNPIETLIDFEDKDHDSMQLFQMQRRGGITHRMNYSPLYLEFDQKAVPYRYINLVRTQGAH